MQPMPSGDVKQDRPADRIKGLLAVVVPAFGLLRVGERDAKFFQRLFLLGAQFPIAVLTVKDVPLMDVGRPLVQMERPVQDVDMGTEAALKFLIKLIDDGKEAYPARRILPSCRSGRYFPPGRSCCFSASPPRCGCARCAGFSHSGRSELPHGQNNARSSTSARFPQS